jgi:sarcosine oxidase
VRIVIVGGGVIGLLTAVSCVSAGHEVVLVDQADIPFSGATSFDRHRTLLALHVGDPAATGAAVSSHHRWIGMQRLLSARFYEQVGALTVLPAEHLSAAGAMLTTAGSRARVLDSGALTAAYPHVRFPAGASAVFESLAGVLLADRVLTACADWLRSRSHARLQPRRRAVRVDVDRAAVQLADGEVLRADALLLATGPWSAALLAPELARDLVLRRQSVIYCEVPRPDAAAWSATPAIRSLGPDGGTWLMPPVAGTPLKLSAASACRVVARIGDRATPPYWRDHLIGAARATIPGFRAGWVSYTRDCYYLARASTGGPMLAGLGPATLAYAACGGSSFKFAPLIAQSLAERLTGADPAPTGLHFIDGEIAGVPPETATSQRPALPARPGRPAMRGGS